MVIQHLNMKTAVLFFLIPIVGIAQMNFEKKLPSNAPYQTEIISGDGVSAYGDLDNDGDLDLITTVSAYTVNYTRVYLNENGNFIRQSSSWTLLAAVMTRTVPSIPIFITETEPEILPKTQASILLD